MEKWTKESVMYSEKDVPRVQYNSGFHKWYTEVQHPEKEFKDQKTHQEIPRANMAISIKPANKRRQFEPIY